MTAIYSTGTVTVTNGSADVTGSGTAWAVALVAGGVLNIEAAGNAMPIASVTDDTHLTGAVEWTGATGTYNYAIVRESSDAASVVDVFDRMSRILVTLSLAGITPNASGTIAERDALTLAVGDKGFLFLHAEIGYDFEFYRWSGSAWEGPFATRGVQGPAGVGAGGLGLPTPGAANKLAYYTGANTLALTDLTSTARTLLASSSLAGLQLAAGVREVLTSARSYFVRTDGSDSNNGLTNTSGGAFLTVQKALNTVSNLDIGTNNVTIQVGDGTYTGVASVSAPWLGSGQVTIQGNSGTPSNVVINSPSGDYCVNVQNNGVLFVKGLKLVNAGNYCLYSRLGGYINYANIEFGAALSAHMLAEDSGMIVCGGNYSISGATGAHWRVSGGSIRCQTRTITLTGTPTFSNGFAFARNIGYMVVNANTFSGSATGPHYDVALNSVVQTAGGGDTYLPGNSAGVTATGGVYA